MRYNVANRSNLDRIENLLEELLLMRGVEDPSGFLHLTPDILIDPFSFRNMNEAVDLLYKHINNGKVHIIIDSDTDGITSASAIYGYITRYNGIECTYDAHTAKQHGMYEAITNRIPEGTTLLVIPDAGSDDKSLLWITNAMMSGMDVLVLDHHEIGEAWEKVNGIKDDGNNVAVLINNQDGSYGNTTLSGVGVVFKFLMAFDEVYPSDNVEAMDFLGLTALGIISDLMDCRNHETRFIINSGLKYMADDSELLQTIIENNSYAIKDKLTISSVGWNVAPYLNACFRQGTRDDKLMMFEAMCGIGADRTFTHIPSRKTENNPNKEPIEESLAQHVARFLAKLKREQDKQKKESSQVLVDKIEGSSLKDEKIIIMDTTDIINPTHTGITANELAKKYQRPVLLLTSYNDTDFGGSGRNYDKFEIDNLNEFVEASGIAKAQGHAQAFGISIPKNKVDEFRQYCNEKLANVDIRPVFHVDFEIPLARLKERHILQVGAWQDMWGGKGMDAPLFAITGIQIDSAEIKMIKRLMKFETIINGQTITFIRPRTSDEFYKMVVHETDAKRIGRSGESGNKKLDITVIGKFIINEFNGKSYPQIEIVEMSSEIAKGGRKRRL